MRGILLFDACWSCFIDSSWLRLLGYFCSWLLLPLKHSYLLMGQQHQASIPVTVLLQIWHWGIFRAPFCSSVLISIGEDYIKHILGLCRLSSHFLVPAVCLSHLAVSTGTMLWVRLCRESGFLSSRRKLLATGWA